MDTPFKPLARGLAALLLALLTAACSTTPAAPETTQAAAAPAEDLIAEVGAVPLGGTCGQGHGACDADGFCAFPAESPCGEAGVPGVCTARPTGCRRDCPGVCGCDGHRFCNACVARARGFSVRHPGKCEESPDAP